jgi:hypothetical protein
MDDLATAWQSYQARRNKWVAHNFPNDNPKDEALASLMGIIEEVGELAHAHLKQRQNIRGNPAKHVADAKDAVGDATVYLWGVTAATKATFDKYFWECVSSHKARHRKDLTVGSDTDASILGIGGAANSVKMLVEAFCRGDTAWSSEYVTSKLVAELWVYCEQRGWDYNDIVEKTWNHVEPRDWIRWPKSGYPPALVTVPDQHDMDPMGG